jgi:hypothetical protein
MIILTPSISGAPKHGYSCVGESGIPHITYARHCTLAFALNNYKEEDQLWLDSDIEISNDQIKELYRIQQKTNAEIVSGWYANHAGTRPLGNPSIGGYHHDYTIMNDIGFGCVLIKPTVWNKLEKTTWRIKTNRGYCPAVFASIPNDEIDTTEDYFFCRRCKMANITIVAANNVLVRHYDQETIVKQTYQSIDPEKLKKSLINY